MQKGLAKNTLLIQKVDVQLIGQRETSIGFGGLGLFQIIKRRSLLLVTKRN